MNLQGEYQCTRKTYFWEDKPRIKESTLKVEQSGIHLQWQLGSTVGDWTLNGRQNLSYKLGSKDLHKVTCLEPQVALKAEEAFSVDSRVAVYRTVEVQRESASEIFMKLHIRTAFGNNLLDEQTERWICRLK